MVANPKFNAVIDISFLDDEDKREVQTEHRVKNREDGCCGRSAVFRMDRQYP